MKNNEIDEVKIKKAARKKTLHSTQLTYEYQQHTFHIEIVIQIRIRG